MVSIGALAPEAFMTSRPMWVSGMLRQVYNLLILMPSVNGPQSRILHRYAVMATNLPPP
jgi:hypothetical protein